MFLPCLRALALLLGFLLVSFTAGRRGIPAARAQVAALLAIATYLSSVRVILAAVLFREFLAHPWWVLGLAPGFAQALAAVLVALAAVWLYAASWSLPVRSVLDTLTPGALLAFALLQVINGWTAPGPDSAMLALCGLLACWCAYAPLPPSLAGAPTRAGLFVLGVLVLLLRLVHPMAAAPLVAGLYTPQQAWAVLAILAALAIRTSPAKQTAQDPRPPLA